MPETQEPLSAKKDILFREYLATDRTLLAIDRTILSYIRTGLTFFVAGISFIKFFDSLSIQLIGFGMVIAAVITFIIGIKRCLDTKKFIKKLAKKNGFFPIVPNPAPPLMTPSESAV